MRQFHDCRIHQGKKKMGVYKVDSREENGRGKKTISHPQINTAADGCSQSAGNMWESTAHPHIRTAVVLSFSEICLAAPLWRRREHSELSLSDLERDRRTQLRRLSVPRSNG